MSLTNLQKCLTQLGSGWYGARLAGSPDVVASFSAIKVSETAKQVPKSCLFLGVPFILLLSCCCGCIHQPSSVVRCRLGSRSRLPTEQDFSQNVFRQNLRMVEASSLKLRTSSSTSTSEQTHFEAELLGGNICTATEKQSSHSEDPSSSELESTKYLPCVPHGHTLRQMEKLRQGPAA